MKMMSYFQKRRKAKLFNQWVKESKLPPEELPTDLLSGQSEKGTDDDIRLEMAATLGTKRVAVDNGIVHLPVRYVMTMVSIIAILLAVSSVVVTILITRP